MSVRHFARAACLFVLTLSGCAVIPDKTSTADAVASMFRGHPLAEALDRLGPADEETPSGALTRYTWRRDAYRNASVTGGSLFNGNAAIRLDDRAAPDANSPGCVLVLDADRDGLIRRSEAWGNRFACNLFAQALY